MLSKSDVGCALKTIRVKKQISQELLGPSQSFVSSIERGLRSPTVEKLQQFATLLGISPVTLLAQAALSNDESIDTLLATVRKELEEIAR